MNGHDALVLAKFELFRRVEAERTEQKAPPAIAAKVKSHLLVYVVADFFAFHVVQAFEDVLDFLEMVAVVVQRVVNWIERGVDFHFDDVPEILLWIERTLAAVA